MYLYVPFSDYFIPVHTCTYEYVRVHTRVLRFDVSLKKVQTVTDLESKTLCMLSAILTTRLRKYELQRWDIYD